jgi:hypothetical protein
MINQSALERFIGATKITTRGIRWAFIVVVAYLLINLEVVISFSNSPAGASKTDWIYLVVIGCLAVPVIAILGWLGFSPHGIKLTARALAQGGVENRSYRFGKTLTGAVGLAGIPWMLLFVGISITGNHDLMHYLFNPLVIAILVLLCFPISRRYMR